MTDILERLQPIFRDVMDQPELVVRRESNAQSVQGWDSLVHINLIIAVEGEFGIRFPLGELEEMKNVGDMIDSIHKKLGE